MQPLVLTYNLQPEKLAKLRVLCLRLGIRIHIVQPEEYGLPIGALAGMTSAPEGETPAEPFADEMLVMAAFRPGMLDAFLNGFRQSRIPPVALKAMVTETNAGWTSPELHRAILEEHEMMRQAQKKK